MPPIVLWTLGALGAAAVMRALAREWRRVNTELERLSSKEPECEKVPKLRRDPASGVYRPE